MIYPSETPVLQRAIRISERMCATMDRRMPPSYRIDGFSHFTLSFVPLFLRPHQIVYDIGGGKRPTIDLERKHTLGLTVVGIDILQEELDRAPEGAYDHVICRDITTAVGDGDADLIICRTVLEHVRSTKAAIEALATILRPGGVALIFVPCRNAWFARMNILLPPWLKTRILDLAVPDNRERDEHGFCAYYDHCTPSSLANIAATCGMEVKAQHLYYMSSYCAVFPPLFVAWRLWTLVMSRIAPSTHCETFAMALVRR